MEMALTCANKWVHNCASWLNLCIVSHDEGQLGIHRGATNVGSVLQREPIDKLPLTIYHPSSYEKLKKYYMWFRRI